MARDAFPPVAAGVCRARPFADSAGRRYQMRPKGWRSNFVVCNPMTIKGHSDSKLLEDARACGNSLPFKDAQPWPGTFSEGRADVARGPGGGATCKMAFLARLWRAHFHFEKGTDDASPPPVVVFFFLRACRKRPSSRRSQKCVTSESSAQSSAQSSATPEAERCRGNLLSYTMMLHLQRRGRQRRSRVPDVHAPPPACHLSSILVLARSSFSRISGSWASSSQAEPQPKTRARSLPVPRGRTPSWHWGRHRDVSGREGVRRGRAEDQRPHLFVQRQRVDLRQHPAHAAVASAHQNPEGVKLLEETQPGDKRGP